MWWRRFWRRMARLAPASFAHSHASGSPGRDLLARVRNSINRPFVASNTGSGSRPGGDGTAFVTSRTGLATEIDTTPYPPNLLFEGKMTPLLRTIGCCWIIFALPILHADAQGKASFMEIDPATITAYEKKHFADPGFWIEHS